MGQIRVDKTLELLKGKLLSPMRKEVQRHYFRYNSCFQTTPKAKSQELYTPSPFVNDPWEDIHFILKLPRTTKGFKSIFMDVDKLFLRKVTSHCSGRLTGIVFARGLFLRVRAPSSCSVCEYLKEVNKRAPSQPFVLRRSSQLARNTKVTENCMIISMTETVWLKLCCPNCLVLPAECCEDN